MSELQLPAYLQDLQRQVDRGTDADIKAKYGLDKVYRLAQNENPLGPSPKVVEAIAREAIDLSEYPTFSDIALRQAIVNTLPSDQLTPNHIYTGCSGFETLELIARTFLLPGDEVIISNPTFTAAYGKVTKAQGASLVDVPLHAESYTMDIDGILAAINERTRLIMVCNPNNPTGAVVTATEMDQLMRDLPERVIVVSDEVYFHFVEHDAFPDSIKYVLENKNIIIVHSFSKAYGMAGLRLGYGIARPEIADKLDGMHRGFHQNRLAIAAGVAACGDQAYLQQVISFVHGEMEWMLGELDRLDIAYFPPSANFVLMDTPIPSAEITPALMERGILVRPQHKAGMPHKIRVSIGSREANEAFIKALEEILLSS